MCYVIDYIILSNILYIIIYSLIFTFFVEFSSRRILHSFLFVFSGIILLAGSQTPAVYLSDSHILSIERMCFQTGSGKWIRCAKPMFRV